MKASLLAKTSGEAGLRITVHDEIDGKTTDLLFNEFPIRVGRSKMNDLVLSHQYVSQWHAVIGFEAGELSITQVGRSNSVRVGDRKLEPGEALVLAGGEEIRLIPFTLHFQVVALPPHLQSKQPPKMTISPVAGMDAKAFDQTASRVIDQLSMRFMGRTAATPEEIAEFGSRIEQTLDVFTASFVALQMGQHQFRQSLDIKALGHTDNPVKRAQDGAELASLLLSFNEQDIAVSLEQAFKDIMIHQVALLNGLMAGVENLVAKLSPKTVAAQASKQHRSPSWRHLWQTFEKIHKDLSEEDAATFDTVFGRRFGEAYSTMADKKD